MTTLSVQLTDVAQRIAANDTENRLARRALANAADATLLFHSGGHWSHARREEWKRLTGEDEATTRTLCSFVRTCLKTAGIEPLSQETP